VLGYSSVREKSHVRRVGDESQAVIVRRIFTLCAEGRGLKRIAKALNADVVPNPTAQNRTGSKKAAAFWSTTGVREVLHRALYRGQVVYGQTRWQDKGGARVKVDVPEAKWLRLDAPELRIFSEELWDAAHARMTATHAVYLRRNGGQLYGKPESGLESRYLMSGFLRCGVCKGAMQINKRMEKHGRPPLVYVCGTHEAAAMQPVPRAVACRLP